MSVARQSRRGTTANHAAFTGLAGELTVDSDKKTVVVHDGATAGGFPLKRDNVSATNKVLGRSSSGAGAIEEIDCSAAARTVLDDATVADMVNTLGGASSTGSGGLVRATSPTLVAPVLGTPASGNLSGCTNLPPAGVSGQALVRNNNLSDISVPATCRTNLGFGAFMLHTMVPWHARGDAAMTLTDVAAADAFLGKSNGNVAQLDLTHYTHVRVTCRVTGAGTAGTKIVAKYRTVAAGYSATISDYVAIGTSAVETDLSATGVIASAWIPLASGAKADVLLCPVQTGGDGATDPTIRLYQWEFKRE